MKCLRGLAVLLCFFLEVRIHATTDKTESCWGKEIPCAIATETSRRVLEAGPAQLVLGPHAILEQKQESAVHLIRGELYTDAGQGVAVSTPFAKFVCESDCLALFTRQPHQVLLKALRGQWRVSRLGDTESYAVQPGFQLRVAEVSTEGMAHMEFPQSLPWLATTKEWARLFPGEAAEFKATLVEFRSSWKQAVEAASDIHQEEALRQIASHEASLREARARQASRELEDQRLRKLFREKNYLNP